MQDTSSLFDSASVTKPTVTKPSPSLLAAGDWRVWFLGYGLGGCAGLCLCAGVWSLMVDDQLWLGAIALIVAGAHGGLLTICWLNRTKVEARIATAVCFLAGAAGILLVALLLNQGESRVPALNSLYALAVMSAVMAFTVPLLPTHSSHKTDP